MSTNNSANNFIALTRMPGPSPKVCALSRPSFIAAALVVKGRGWSGYGCGKAGSKTALIQFLRRRRNTGVSMSHDLCVDADGKAEMMCVGDMLWHRRNAIDRNANAEEAILSRAELTGWSCAEASMNSP